MSRYYEKKLKNSWNSLELKGLMTILNHLNVLMMEDSIVLRFQEYNLQKIMDTLLKKLLKNEITIHRITQTKGINAAY